ncbi:unnamed protein product [Haemonchus placei]|uniref:Uncharacterized protein n=1 Tax=Haemonchus placei TaxID=6290 RepID=A0A3P7SMX7_HAEPC|nr:unnamed protein product [Haemonchus placei]
MTGFLFTEYRSRTAGTTASSSLQSNCAFRKSSMASINSGLVIASSPPSSSQVKYTPLITFACSNSRMSGPLLKKLIHREE